MYNTVYITLCLFAIFYSINAFDGRQFANDINTLRQNVGVPSFVDPQFSDNCLVPSISQNAGNCTSNRTASLELFQDFMVLTGNAISNIPGLLRTSDVVGYLFSTDADWFQQFYGKSLMIGNFFSTIYSGATSPPAFPPNNVTDYVHLWNFFMDAFPEVAFGGASASDYNSENLITPENVLTDDTFSVQRMIGIDTHFMRLITINDSSRGVDWNDLLSTRLNSTYNFDDAIAYVSTYSSVEEAVIEGRVFASYCSECDNIITDVNAIVGVYKGLPWHSPTALFVKVNNHDLLVPFAIQLDIPRENASTGVFTPADSNDTWDTAKFLVEGHFKKAAQIVEHLVQDHFIMENICVSAKRHLGTVHPLRIILDDHCIATMLTNTLAIQVVYNPTGTLNQVSDLGTSGVLQLINEARDSFNWSRTHHINEMTTRGLDDQVVLPYHPFRDDGILVFNGIADFVSDYVNLYYTSNNDVSYDFELQNFVREVSTEIETDSGTNNNGKGGQVQGFPSSIDDLSQLKDTMTRIIWLATGLHVTNQYQVFQQGSGSNQPGSPSALHTECGTVPLDNFLPTSEVTIASTLFDITITNNRYNQLLHYAVDTIDRMDWDAKNVAFHAQIDMMKISKKIIKNNKDRVNAGLPKYIYLNPVNVLNGVNQ